MYTIYWDYKTFKGNKVSFESREEANEVWKLLQESGATNMHPEKPVEKKNIVKVVFPSGSKRYTYLTKEKVEVGALVVVWTSEGRQVVKVVDSGTMSISELEKICPISRFKYIEGKVVAA